MSELKIGDRVKVISDPRFIEFTREKSIIGMTGTVKELNETHADVEFDDYGENGSCWYVPYDYLEKIEETEEETKGEVDMESKEEWIVFLDKYDIPVKQNAYRTREEAISEGRKEIAKISAKYMDSEVFGERIESGVSSFYVGKVGRNEPGLFADDIIDDLISDAEKMYGDTADNFLEYVSKQDKEELEVEVNKVIREWIDNHNFMACGLLVEKIEKIEV